MSHKEHIDIDYLARVEGETAIRIELKKQPALEFKIFEPPRFFEGFLVGRKFDEVGDIVSRICGICPISHMTTAIQAIEDAMDIEVSQQTKVLRDLMTISQIAASHLIHLYMLAMPDYLGYCGITEMLPGFKKEVNRLMKMKEVLNGLAAVIGGRALHPVTHMPGGFTSIPKKDDLLIFSKKLNEVKNDAREVVKDISKFKIPDFHCQTEYVALDKKDEYAISHGRIVSTLGMDISVDDYPNYFKETEVSYAFAKQSIIKGRGHFMVGALARLHIKFDKLQPETKILAEEIGFNLPNDNPFFNNLAQSLEVFDGILRCIKLIETNDFIEEDYHVKIRAGHGCSMTEAPRGLLYHWYKINEKGIVEDANMVTPTAHNFLNIETGLRKLAKENLDKKRDEIRLMCEQLVRAYDPCFSCSVH